MRRRRIHLFLTVILALMVLAGCGKENAAVPSEPTQTASADLRELSREFHGTISVAGKEERLNLLYYPTGADGFACDLIIGGEVITIPLREDFRAETVEKYEIWDVNQDGCQDVIVDHGILGRIKTASCYVYTEDGFVAVPGFEELTTPHWSETGKSVVEEWSIAPENGVNRYSVRGTELVLEESLSCIHNRPEYGSDPCYTVKKRIDGEMVEVKTHVAESEIDLEYWYS